MTEEKKWFGNKPEKCQLCGEEIVGLFVDCKTYMGPWALMCVHCWHQQGGPIGTGRGQMYDLLTLKKIAG
jgi:hypothetical protein